MVPDGRESQQPVPVPLRAPGAGGPTLPRVTTFVLLPGAGGEALYWEPVRSRLVDAGHHAIAMDLPADDPGAGLTTYADLTVTAASGRDDVVLVAHSMGGFTAPLVAARRPVRALVFVNAMIPVPGETAAAWWEAVDSEPARLAAAEQGGYPTEFDDIAYFLHDVPASVLGPAELESGRAEVEIAFTERCDFDGWPDVAIRVLVGRDDRLFPAEFQRRVARERLGVEADVLPGGHLLPLANPAGVTDYLLATPSGSVEPA